MLAALSPSQERSIWVVMPRRRQARTRRLAKGRGMLAGHGWVGGWVSGWRRELWAILGWVGGWAGER